jgi:hypothetical protein
VVQNEKIFHGFVGFHGGKKLDYDLLGSKEHRSIPSIFRVEVKLEATCSLKTLEIIYKTTRCHKADDHKTKNKKIKTVLSGLLPRLW